MGAYRCCRAVLLGHGCTPDCLSDCKAGPRCLLRAPLCRTAGAVWLAGAGQRHGCRRVPACRPLAAVGCRTSCSGRRSTLPRRTSSELVCKLFGSGCPIQQRRQAPGAAAARWLGQLLAGAAATCSVARPRLRAPCSTSRAWLVHTCPHVLPPLSNVCTACSYQVPRPEDLKRARVERRKGEALKVRCAALCCAALRCALRQAN